MTRSITLATLALFPVLLHAQAITPAQPQTPVNPQVLLARLSAPAVAGSVTSVDTPGTAPAPHVYSGLTAPRLIQSFGVSTGMDDQWRVAGFSRKATISMIVDKTGKPVNLKVVNTAGPDLDDKIIAAVSRYRFAPATLDQQPTAMELNLTVEVLRPAGE